MWRAISQSKPLKYGILLIPNIAFCAGGYLYYDRSQKLDNPITHRALKVLASDKRVVDFCGSNIKPGWRIQKKVSPKFDTIQSDKDGTTVYSFNISGGSGKLKTVITADHALHGSLKIFNEELEEHKVKKEKKEKDYDVKDFEDNWPIDLEE